jgi:hypothetical protein
MAIIQNMKEHSTYFVVALRRVSLLYTAEMDLM